MQRRPIMSKFEVTRLLCARAQQLSEGAPSTMPAEEVEGALRDAPLRLALAELETHRIPMKVSRVMPDGSRQTWKTGEMVLPRRLLEHIRSLDFNLRRVFVMIL
jgi:DNA-directed RNA polymerase subunit K/omega